MLSEERKQDIQKQAIEVNKVAEDYQLIHACFAVQKILNERIQNHLKTKVDKLSEKFSDENLSNEQLLLLHKEKTELELECARQHIIISVRYLDTFYGENARVTIIGLYKNVFMISLPAELKGIRDGEGTFDYEKMKRLRKLMAHELGHILLHTDSIINDIDVDDEDKEDESKYFAEIILELRKQRNRKFYGDKCYEMV